MKKCYLCEEDFSSKNLSTEHIIPNAIGGRLKSKNLLCKECNSKFGYKADKKLAKQLAYFSNFFRIKRDKGETPIVKGAKTKTGVEFYLLSGDKPLRTKPGIVKNDDGKETKYDLVARDKKEMIQMLSGLKRKHPEVDIESLLDKMQWDYSYLNEPLTYNIGVGGDRANLTIVKIAVNYYLLKAKATEQVRHLFPYLKGDDSKNICTHYYTSAPIYTMEPNEVTHLIHLHGSKESKILYCLVEFFSIFTFLVCLSNQYSGPDLKETYCYDLILNKEVQKEINHTPKQDSFLPKKTEPEFFDTITKKMNRALKIGSKINTEEEIKGFIKRAIEKVFMNHEHESVFTEQMAKEISEEVGLNYSKFIFRDRK